MIKPTASMGRSTVISCDFGGRGATGWVLLLLLGLLGLVLVVGAGRLAADSEVEEEALLPLLPFPLTSVEVAGALRLRLVLLPLVLLLGVVAGSMIMLASLDDVMREGREARKRWSGGEATD